MKKIYKKPLLTFIIGAIIFGTTGVLAGTFIAKDVTYDNSKSSINANNVQDAIDVLYTKANEGAPESYTGSYTYTPSTSIQTIYSANKKFNDNITINPIPTNYKDMNNVTNFNSSDLKSGQKAYNKNGELVEGTLDIITSYSNYGRYTPTDLSVKNINVGFKPKKVYIVIPSNNSGCEVVYVYNMNNNNKMSGWYDCHGDPHTVSEIDETKYGFTITNSGFTYKPGDSSNISLFYWYAVA